MEASSPHSSYLDSLSHCPALFCTTWSQVTLLITLHSQPSPTRMEGREHGNSTWHSLCVSLGPRLTSGILSWINECAHCTPGYFSQDIVWHSRKTADKNLNPVRKQKDLFGKMKQNIFLSCINIWWMLTRYFQNKKHIETAYVSGQVKL